MENLQRFLNRADGIEQASISGMSVFGADCSRFRGNKTFVLSILTYLQTVFTLTPIALLMVW